MSAPLSNGSKTISQLPCAQTRSASPKSGRAT
jgi:hypothetical protein